MPERALPVKPLPYECSLRVPFPRGVVRSGYHAHAGHSLREAFTAALATWGAESRQTRDTAGASEAPHAERPGMRHRCQMPLKHGPGGAPVCASYQGRGARGNRPLSVPRRVGTGQVTCERAHVDPGTLLAAGSGKGCPAGSLPHSQKARHRGVRLQREKARPNLRLLKSLPPLPAGQHTAAGRGPPVFPG